MIEREEILNSLKPLFKKAETEKLAFYCSYQDMWFTPAELRECHAHGRFIWGLVNWRLRDPRERIEELKRSAQSAEKRLDDGTKRWEEFLK